MKCVGALDCLAALTANSVLVVRVWGTLLTFVWITAAAAASQVTYETKPDTITATIEAIDKTTRTVTLKGLKGNLFDVKAPDEVEGFNSLKVGDQVTATYFAAVALHLRKPGEPAPSTEPTTTTTRKDRTPGSETRRQQTFTATITAIDPKAPSVTVRGPLGRIVPLMVNDAKQLQNVKVGDTIDVTYYESMLIKVARPPKPKG
jgi:hypothetical protein